MKKRYLLILLLLVAFIWPCKVLAADPEKYYINIDINSDGSLSVKEAIALEDVSYNGIYRAIYYKSTGLSSDSYQINSNFYTNSWYDASGISDIVVGTIANKSSLTFASLTNPDYTPSTLETYASNGDKNVYTSEDLYDGVNIKMYNPSTTGAAFYLAYTIKDAVVVHNDVAELNWNIFSSSSGYDNDINNMELHINLPSTDKTLRVWLHGNTNTLNGTIENVGNKYALIKYNYLAHGNPLSFRLMFNKDLVPNATKMSGVDGKEGILKVENELATAANNTRNFNKLLYYGGIALFVIWFLLLIISLIKYYQKKKELNMCSFDLDYYREFPGDYGPETTDYLLHHKITNNSAGASIMMMIEKKVLKIEANPNQKKDYFLITTGSNFTSLTEPEKQLYTFIINDIGDGSKVSLHAIKHYGEDETKANTFIRKINDWKDDVIADAATRNFFITSPKEKTFVNIVCVMGFFIGIYNAFIGSFLGFIAIIVNIIVMIAISSDVFRSSTGLTEYKEWLALKKFMQDFGNMNTKELPEVPLWGKYLVYATVLGCAEELRKQMKIKIAEMNIDESTLYSYYWYDNTWGDGFFVTNAIASTMNSAGTISTSTIASSTMSSGGGFGGGSSFGGGSGGGGGGGGSF